MLLRTNHLSINLIDRALCSAPDGTLWLGAGSLSQVRQFTPGQLLTEKSLQHLSSFLILDLKKKNTIHI